MGLKKRIWQAGTAIRLFEYWGNKRLGFTNSPLFGQPLTLYIFIHIYRLYDVCQKGRARKTPGALKDTRGGKVDRTDYWNFSVAKSRTTYTS